MQSRPEPRGSRRPEQVLLLFAWLLLAAALSQTLVSLSLYFAGRPAELWYFLSSDTVGYWLLYDDLFVHGFSWWGWNVSHAPEYVQMAWYFLLRRLTGDSLHAHVLEALFHPCMLAAALALLFRALDRRATALGPLLAAALVLLFNTGHAADFIAFFWSARHGSTVVVAVAALAMLIRAVLHQKRAAGGLCLAFAAVGAASDLLFLPAFTVPALATMALLLLLRQLPRALAVPLMAGTAGATAIGYAAFRAFTPRVTVGSKLGIRPQQLPDAVAKLLETIGEAGGAELVFAALVGVFWAIALARLARDLRLGRPASGPTVAALFGVLMTSGLLLAVVATGAPLREAGFTRYLLPVYTAALIGVGYALWSALGRRGGSRVATAAASGLVAVALAACWKSPTPGTPSIFDYYPGLVRCIDDATARHRVQYGVANYWLAKLVTALSHRDLRVHPVRENLAPYPFFGSIEWFLGGVGARHHDRPRYGFAILGGPADPGISPGVLEPLGARAVEECFGFRVVVLEEGADQEIRRRFRERPVIRGYYASHGLPLP